MAQVTNETDNVSLIINFIYKFGIPSAIAILLVYFLVSRVDHSLANLETTLQTHQMDSLKDMEIQRGIEEHLSIQTQVLQSICVNTARTSVDRTGCFKTN